MFKIAITGKANSGKNTLGTLIADDLLTGLHNKNHKMMAFADPIKEMVKIMFPTIPRKWLYGSSKLRSKVIEGAFDAEGNPLTVRQALLDAGTKGRQYNDKMWLNIFDYRFKKEQAKNTNAIICSDCRFRNEFDYLKENDFYMIKIMRNTDTVINHVSETNQDSIKDSEFHWVIDNNDSLENLTLLVKNSIVSEIKKHCSKQ